MTATPEKKVKLACTALLKKHGAYHFLPVTGGFGKSGVPDIIVCYRGLFLGIECKAGKGKTTALQEREMEFIRAAGGSTLVIRENNINELQEWLDARSSPHG